MSGISTQSYAAGTAPPSDVLVLYYQRVSNIDFVAPLLQAMLKRSVDANSALQMWREIRAQVPQSELQKALVYGSCHISTSDEDVGFLREQ